jgi:hypothetical protein
MFNIFKLKGRIGRIRDWMINNHIPLRVLIIALGLISTIWFLIRVIPKPSRASYPCMRVAAPFMSGLIVYLLAVGGFTFMSRKLKRRIISVRYFSTFLLALGVVVVMAVIPSNRSLSYQEIPSKLGPDDGPNQPFGKATGVYPGRVVWAWDPDATNENCTNDFETADYWFTPENTNQDVVSKMVRESVNKLAGRSSPADSWDALFRDFNMRKSLERKGYSRGERIFIKINQTSSRGGLSQNDKDNGYFIPRILAPEQERRRQRYGTAETGPAIVLELLRQLVNDCGIDQSDISVGDPQNPIYGHNYEAWVAEFPGVVYIDKVSSNFGRTLIKPTENDLVFYSDKTQSDKLVDVIENASYLINVADLKPHGRAGITLSAKNHFGSQSKSSASHLHRSLVSPFTVFSPTNSGYYKYRVLVDLMGSKYLGRNTVLFVIDGLFAGGALETGQPVKYFMSPFNNDWSNSLLISQDQVALESVCYDFLRTEWNGINKHNPVNSANEWMPAVNGVDDYLHQAAGPANWPEDIIYDPDRSGKPLTSLGIHEHWNDPVNKQYSRNLGKSTGIELISIPDSLVVSVSTD